MASVCSVKEEAVLSRSEQNGSLGRFCLHYLSSRLEWGSVSVGEPRFLPRPPLQALTTPGIRTPRRSREGEGGRAGEMPAAGTLATMTEIKGWMDFQVPGD